MASPSSQRDGGSPPSWTSAPNLKISLPINDRRSTAASDRMADIGCVGTSEQCAT